MASSSDKIFIQCGESFKENNPLIEDAQQTSVRHVPRRFAPGLFDFKNDVFILKNLVLTTKDILISKTLKTASIMDTKIYISTLQIYRDREDNGAKNIKCRLLGIRNFVAREARYHSACR